MCVSREVYIYAGNIGCDKVVACAEWSGFDAGYKLLLSLGRRVCYLL